MLLSPLVANGQKKLQERQSSEEMVSERHLTIRRDSSKGDFFIGKFESERSCPGFPLDPKVLKEKENIKVNWVEIEFTDKAGTSFWCS
jgi:hypothetical protein